MPNNLVTVSFWASLAAVIYTFLGYPLLIYALSRLRPARPRRAAASFTPTVTVVLAAHNETPRIPGRLQNLLAADYPPDKLNVVIVSDGSTDDTVAQIEALRSSRVQCLVEPQRRGKAHALNLAVAAARAEIIVFADVRQTFAPDAVTQLANWFADPAIGAVSGELMIDPAASAVGGGVDVYWRLEKFIRHAESRWDSSVGCTGAIYAIRRGLFVPLAPDTILDDVVIPMRIAGAGFRVAFEPAARAYDPQTLEPGRERVRKRRTLAGNYQMLARQPGWLLPWRHRLCWQLLSHKYLRLAAPVFLALCFLCNALLLPASPYWFLFYGQAAFYLLALGGLVFHTGKSKLFSLPAGFVFLNWMSLAGLWHYLARHNESVWEVTGQPAPPRNLKPEPPAARV
jgi:cellulose synthase/poly-beta-1,6-N-acetylglucosamine synthase-like glycosyltransferase